MLGILRDPVGRTPWSALIPLDPLFSQPKQPHAIPERPAGGAAADQGLPLAARNAHMWDRPPGLSLRFTPRY